jgi:hypothetical protein
MGGLQLVGIDHAEATAGLDRERRDEVAGLGHGGHAFDRNSGPTRKDRGLVTKTPGRRSWVHRGPGSAYLPRAPLGQPRDPCIPP